MKHLVTLTLLTLAARSYAADITVSTQPEAQGAYTLRLRGKAAETLYAGLTVKETRSTYARGTPNAVKIFRKEGESLTCTQVVGANKLDENESSEYTECLMQVNESGRVSRLGD